MNNTDWEDFWWNNITGPSLIVSSVSEALNENKKVLLNVPEDLPWRQQMRSAIEIAFRKNAETENVYVQTVDAKDECQGQAVGSFLLETYGQSREIRDGYRDRSGHSMQEYLIHNKVLKNTIVWVKGLDKKSVKAWVAFFRDYYTESITDGLFVLEIHEDTVAYDSKNTILIDFQKLVTSYDVQLFDSFFLDGMYHYPTVWKKYISTVVSSLCGVDAEVSLEVISNTDFSCETPLHGIKKVDESGSFSSRGGAVESHHVLSCYRNGRSEELNHRMWSGQIQILFPYIEMERIRLINSLYDEIDKALKREDILQYDEVLTDPNDVELGTLDWLRRKYKINIPQAEIREWISFLHTCRNKLAHMDCCEPEEINRILNSIEEK